MSSIMIDKKENGILKIINRRQKRDVENIILYSGMNVDGPIYFREIFMSTSCNADVYCEDMIDEKIIDGEILIKRSNYVIQFGIAAIIIIENKDKAKEILDKILKVL